MRRTANSEQRQSSTTKVVLTTGERANERTNERTDEAAGRRRRRESETKRKEAKRSEAKRERAANSLSRQKTAANVCCSLFRLRLRQSNGFLFGRRWAGREVSTVNGIWLVCCWICFFSFPFSSAAVVAE